MTTVRIKGPMFDGAAEDAVRALLENVTADAAKQGAAIVKTKAAKFNRSGRGGTGAAAAAVSYHSEGTTAVIKGDSSKGRVWWPWLEGDSKRNASTRFKGYHAFRLASGIMRKRIRAQAEKLLPEYIDRMGG